MSGGNLISVQPDELKFQLELEKPSHCDLKVVNNTEHHVAFKVKTTSPKKYFVRPNTGVVQPWDSSTIRVTLQAQSEYPPDMQCKDKFLLQSTVVVAHTDLDELPPDTFNREGGRVIEECKLRVVYTASAYRDSDDDGFRNSRLSPDSNSNQALQRLRDERDSALLQTRQLQKELEALKRGRYKKTDPGFSFKFALLVAVIGIMVGFLLNLLLSSPSA